MATAPTRSADESVYVSAAITLIAALVICLAIASTLEIKGCNIDTWRGGVVLLCRGTDPIRIWPWPVVQPWSEDGGQTWVEEIAAVYR